MSALRKPIFPFSALLGQPRLQQALMLLALDPRIGGMLISGPRGTAKSTSARALAELLPGGIFITLPLGATEEMLVGSLDVEAALQDAAVRFAPGLLAKAHGGVLYVDEVNLLPDRLVDPLLDAAASGINIVERDGVSHEHAARFALIGTMNPEEGELRPQLLDRFGFALTLENTSDAQTRREIVKARLAFDENPVAFGQRYDAAQAKLHEAIARARAMLLQVRIDDSILDRISALCTAAGVDGMRADLVMTRAAKALAAWQGADTVTVEHVDAVSELALAHRRKRAEDPPRTDAVPDEPRTHATSDEPRPPVSPLARSERPDTGAGAAPRSGNRETGTYVDDRRSTEPSRDAQAAHEANEWGALAPPELAPLPARSVRLPALKKSP